MIRLKTVEAVYTSNSIKIKEGGNTFISDNQKHADYIK